MPNRLTIHFVDYVAGFTSEVIDARHLQIHEYGIYYRANDKYFFVPWHRVSSIVSEEPWDVTDCRHTAQQVEGIKARYRGTITDG